MAVLEFVFFDAGGGHRAAATALKAVIESQNRPWQVRLTNLQEVLDSLDIFRKITGLRLQDIYNQILKKGWTLGAGLLLPGLQGVIRLYHPSTVRLLREHWRESKPDLVVSLVPHFNRALFESLDHAAPFVTILTDFADYPPHFWIERQPQYFICGTEKAVEQARALGHPMERICRVSGMILRPAFYEPVHLDRAAARSRLGLRPAAPTGLVLFGGQGSRVMIDIVNRLEAARSDVQLILICGRNESLARKLSRLPSHLPMFVEGFTDRIPDYMHLADFFIGKPGPGSISEAIAMKLPVIVERNAWTLPQERYNTDWVLENGAGVVIPTFRRIAGAVAELLSPAVFQKVRSGVARINNRAVFEIPDILSAILNRSC
jgi:1,2-diacylglycerol 3-beta-galactosyltransferase